ncbi:MAG: polymer-forming cytoskeletal protein [Candidatus Levybacteria bacterium]|nr:polymer-forming cytoskeletal protein [Candidatus Levybacteria bacterium]
MKLLLKVISYTFLLILFNLILLTPSYAATIRSNESVIVTDEEQNLSNLYLFGERIDVDTKINDDLVAAGGNITINGEVTDDVLAAGGNVNIGGTVSGSLRIAGGNIKISGTTTGDVVAVGGTVTIAETAKINGDVIFAGGQLELNGPVKGKVIIQGGQATINSSVGGNVEGNIGSLDLGKNAVINGDLRYTSSERASIRDGAVIRGKHEFTKDERKETAAKGAEGFFAAFSIYKIIADLIFTLFFVFILGQFASTAITHGATRPLGNLVKGFAYLILMPIASFILFLLIWLGIASFLTYALSLIVALAIGKLLVGWYLLHWYYRREKKDYTLDWKAAIVGVLTITFLHFIPVLGWFAAFIIYLIALGSLVSTVQSVISIEKPVKAAQTKK